MLEDDTPTADALRAGLERSGFTVTWAATCADALAHVATSRFEAVGIRNERARYLGPVLTTSDGVLQQLLIPFLLNEELRTALFQAELAA